MDLNRWTRTAAILMAGSFVAIAVSSIILARSPMLRSRVQTFYEDWRYRYVQLDSRAYKDGPYTLLVFAEGDCAACARGAAKLRTFVASVKPLANVKTRLVTTRRIDEEIPYAESLGLYREEVVHATTDEIMPVRAVPSVVIVNQKGEILFRLTGDLDRLGEVPLGSLP